MTTPTFTLSKDLELPTSAVTEKLAFIGRTGSGKTYAAQKLAEEMAGAGAQFVVLDPVGNWWGLRLAADGKKPGINIPVFGGLHGDVPLEPTSGKLVADLITERGISAILDVSMMRKGQRKDFATEFAEELFHNQKSRRRSQTESPRCPNRSLYGRSQHRMVRSSLPERVACFRFWRPGGLGHFLGSTSRPCLA